MSDNKLKFGCLRGSLDDRDYTFVGALEKLSRQTGQDYAFAVLDHVPDDKVKPPKYKLTKYPSPSSYRQDLQRKPEPDVFVPLSYSLSRQGTLTSEKSGAVERGLDFTLANKWLMRPVDWSPVEDQASGHLCAASAGVSLLEHFERRAEGTHLDASRLFLHYVACKLMNLEPTSGTSVKGVVRALARFGSPPEEFWPYDLEKLTTEPTSFCYALARDFRIASYFRLDHSGLDPDDLITQIKIFISAGLPVIFGFDIYDSVEQSRNNTQPKGGIPLPTFGEKYLGGHAAVIVGYDDDKIIANTNPLGDWDRKNTPVNELFKGEIVPFLMEAKNGQDTNYTPIQWNPDGYYEALSANTLESILSPLKDKNPHLFIGVRPTCKEEDPSAQYGEQPVIDNFVTKGAFKIRNSWGRDWGAQGYGWLPYTYILHGYTFDWWSVLKFDWVNIDDFGFNRKGNEVGYPEGSNYPFRT